MALDSKIPSGPIEKKWQTRKFENKLVNPANRRKHNVIVVGTGLAGASAAATLAELGYKVMAAIRMGVDAYRQQATIRWDARKERAMVAKA